MAVPKVLRKKAKTRAIQGKISSNAKVEMAKDSSSLNTNRKSLRVATSRRVPRLPRCSPDPSSTGTSRVRRRATSSRLG